MKAWIQWMCGFLAVVVVFSSAPAAEDPRGPFSYEGREPGAPWRRAALARIEAERKKDLSMRIESGDGKTMEGLSVDVVLRRHEFGFGTAVPASMLSKQGPDGEKFRGVVDDLFSVVVFENDLKDMYWGNDKSKEEKQTRRDEMDRAFAWLAERHILVRGHYLMQVAAPHNVRGMDATAIRRHFLDTTGERLAFAGDRVCEWDVINHPIAWQGADMLPKRPGLEKLDREVFDLARSLTKLPLLVNEDQLFRRGPQQEGTYAYIERLLADGYPVAALGNQAHLHQSRLPAPEDVLAVTDRFARLVPRQVITEFDIQTEGDEELAADFTRDILIACFSHPAYSSFLFWGFWEGRHWRPDAASWNKDWSIRKRGQALVDLMRGWQTRARLTTDAQGRVAWRGFPGWYEVKPAEGGPSRWVRLSSAQPAATLAWEKP